MNNLLLYFNANPGIGIVIAILALLWAVLTFFTKKKSNKSNHSNSPHIQKLPELHLQLYGSGAKKNFEGHVEKRDSSTLVIESIEIDGSSTTIGQQFTKILLLENLNYSVALFSEVISDISVKVIYRDLFGKSYELVQGMSQQKRADGLFNFSLVGAPLIKEVF